MFIRISNEIKQKWLYIPGRYALWRLFSHETIYTNPSGVVLCDQYILTRVIWFITKPKQYLPNKLQKNNNNKKTAIHLQIQAFASGPNKIKQIFKKITQLSTIQTDINQTIFYFPMIGVYDLPRISVGLFTQTPGLTPCYGGVYLYWKQDVK